MPYRILLPIFKRASAPGIPPFLLKAQTSISRAFPANEKTPEFPDHVLIFDMKQSTREPGPTKQIRLLLSYVFPRLFILSFFEGIINADCQNINKKYSWLHRLLQVGGALCGLPAPVHSPDKPQPCGAGRLPPLALPFVPYWQYGINGVEKMINAHRTTSFNSKLRVYLMIDDIPYKFYNI
jgi:hypothetical protein